jgi:heme-degrading monooxygenase HmoA
MSLHARSTTVTIQSDKIEEAVRIYEESIKPAIMAQQGAKHCYLLIDRSSGKGVSITMWENEADGKAYEASGSYREQVAKLAAFFASAPALETYEVAVTA